MVTSVNNVLQLGDVPVASGFYFNDSFTGATVSQSKWISKAGSGSAEAVLTAGIGAKPTGGIAGAGLTTAIDTVGTGALRLTTADGGQSAFVLFDEAFASNKGVNVTFDFFSYGGNGADGISFFLIDGSTLGANVVPGNAGAGLGYAPNTGTGVPGLTSGYLGIGFDEYGNFSDPGQSSPGGPGRTPDSIAVRGNSTNGYTYLTGTGSIDGGIDNIDATTATRQLALRTAEIDLSSTGILNVAIDLNGDRDFDDVGEQAISNFNIQTLNGAAPTTYKFGFSASTGGLTNIHELRNLALAPSKTSNGGALTTPNPVSSLGDFGTGLTYVENALPGTIAPGLTIAGTPTITSATVKINTVNFNATQDRLTIGGAPLTAAGSIAGTPLTWTYDAPTGAFTLTGAGTAAQYQDALRQVAYANTSDAPTTGDRTIRYTLLNGANTVTLRDALVKINAVDDLPTAVALTSTTVPINQPGAIVASLTITDPDGPTDAPSYSAFGVTGGGDQFEIVPGATAGTYQLKLKAGLSVVAGATIPAITVGFTDAGAPNGGAVSQGFTLTPGQRRAELFWRNPNGIEAFWQLDNAKLVGAAVVNSPYNTPTWSLKGVADLDGDGIKDHVYQNTSTSQIAYLPFTETNGQTTGVKTGVVPLFASTKFGTLNGQAAVPLAGWELVAVENVTGTAQADLIFYSRAADRLVFWETNATGGIVDGGYFTSVSSPGGQGTGAPNTWNVQSVADFTGDGKADVLWRNTQGVTVLWKLNGTAVDLTGSKVLPTMATSFVLAGSGDFNGDGIKDVVWRDNAANITRFWSFNTAGTPVQTADNSAIVGGSSFQIQAIADINGDGKSDLIWRDLGSDRSVLWNLNLGTNPTATFAATSVLTGSGYISNFLPGVTVNTPYVNGDRTWVITAANGLPVAV
jgi:FG-GAP-like repeat